MLLVLLGVTVCPAKSHDLAAVVLLGRAERGWLVVGAGLKVRVAVQGVEEGNQLLGRFERGLLEVTHGMVTNCWCGARRAAVVGRGRGRKVRISAMGSAPSHVEQVCHEREEHPLEVVGVPALRLLAKALGRTKPDQVRGSLRIRRW